MTPPRRSPPAVHEHERPKAPVIDPDDVALLLVDHQSGLFQVVGDLDVPTLRRNATVLAKLATLRSCRSWRPPRSRRAPTGH